MTKRRTNQALWIAQALLTLLFLFAGGMKLALRVAELAKLTPLPGLFLKFIGLCEVLGALGLVLPGILRRRQVLTPLAAAGLTVIVTGATITTLAIGGGATALFPFTTAVIAGLVAWGRLPKPPALHVQRSARIEASPEAVFALLDDFREWRGWSPFEKLDPGMRRTFSGAESGVGAGYAWSGNRKAGEGRMLIVEAVPGSRLRIQLDFTRPFRAHHTAEFTLEEQGGAVQVTWSMDGPGCLMGAVLDMDRLIGRDFEAGLANLKRLAETPQECLRHFASAR